MFAYERANYENTSFIKLTFDQNVEMTEYFYPEFSLSTFLSDLGGTLGLWLGVGVMQIGAYGAAIIRHFKNNFSISLC